jgi:hypothetical protein
MRRIVFIGTVVTTALVLAASAAAATPSATYQVAGIALGASQNDVSSFAGNGTGSAGDRAFWQASLAHAPLAVCAAVGSSCAVTGGTLTLTSNNAVRVTGTVTDGSLTLTAQGRGCGTQTFAVTANVSTAAGQEQLSGVLTQYRLAFRGQCFVLLASFQGSLTLAPPDDGNSF